MLDFSDVPTELRERPQWLVWRVEPGKKKPKKVPYWVNGKMRWGIQGDDNDRKKLVTLEVALRAVATSATSDKPYSGVGFAFLPNDGLIGIDIDKCIDQDTGEISQMASDIVAACASYTEYSPSRTGFHIIVSGFTETFKSNKIGLEVFCSSQFFTFTGEQYAGMPDTISSINDKTLARLRTTVKGSPKAEPARPDRPLSPLPPGGVDERARLEAALAVIDSDEHDIWIRVGMGLYSSLGDDGFRLWDYWSSKADNYGGSDECKKRWASFGKRGAQITAATVFKLAIDRGWKAPRSVMGPPIKNKLPAPLGKNVSENLSAPPPPGEEDMASAGQGPQSEGESLAGANAPETVAAGQGDLPAVADADACNDFPEDRFSDAMPDVSLDDIPYGQTPDFFDQGDGGNAGGKEKPKKIYGPEHWDKVADVLDNFILIYGDDMVWDVRHRMLMKLSSMRTIVQNHDVMKFWGGDARKWVLRKNIVFDPLERPSPATSGPAATVNLFHGWKMQPKKGNCLKIQTLLLHLCDGDEELALWVSRWIAYPLRNRGAKMETSIIMHGDEGSGKNFFFEKVVKKIYGEYGYVIGNAQLESQFNDWASMKLFMVADEVVTRSELKHMKGKLKYLVSGDTIIVNPKGLPEHYEDNHINFVFLSNELQPLALDKTDRRYLVIWTPPALPKEFYIDVAAEIDAGGIEAYYDYLLNELDMGDFDQHTKPIYNDAKENLIEKSLSPPERFYRDWSRGFLPLPFITCAVNQLYDAYKVWCERSGEPRYISLTLFSPSVERYAGDVIAKKLIKYDIGNDVKQRSVFLVGTQPEGKTFAEWAEGACASFGRYYDAYRSRVSLDVEG
ncbi:MAG: PriCT-2 domain-containing protein [Formivibrio sp.]|nr:PriCT-2 domain-containing protein [Formivibrio sp.]